MVSATFVNSKLFIVYICGKRTTAVIIRVSICNLRIFCGKTSNKKFCVSKTNQRVFPILLVGVY